MYKSRAATNPGRTGTQKSSNSRNAFARYNEFVVHLDELLALTGGADTDERPKLIAGALDGDAARWLTELVSRKERRLAGAFFTGETLATKVVSRIPFNKKTKIIDPTLGAGDLLLAAARRFSALHSRESLIERWRAIFSGLEQHEVMVEVAKRRLLLLSRHLSGSLRTNHDPEVFNRLRTANVFETPDAFADITDVVLNPPFIKMACPKWFNDAQGKVNSAALVTTFVLNHLPNASRIHAILPEVLRTGSRYERWRLAIGKMSAVRDVVSCGIFDSADVDVFIATFEKAKVATVNSGWAIPAKHSSTIGDYFDVYVGPVVDYRDPKRGPPMAFVHPRNCPPWTEVHRIAERRRFSGHNCAPPFVVIRRTSRPGDKWRALATIVMGKRRIAVENHLIICSPKSGGLGACRDLANMLKSETVNEFLNKEMRCRHLTVSVVKNIPLPHIPSQE